MAKTSFYDLLGISDKATVEEIQVAFEHARAALEGEPDAEERRNRLAFLQHARDSLLDRRKRAFHDHANRQALNASVQSPKRRSGWWLAGIAGVVAGYVLAWWIAKPVVVPVAIPVAAHPAPQTLVAASAPLPALDELDVRFPERAAPPGQSESPPSSPPAPATPPAKAMAAPAPIQVVIRGDPVMDKILRSTYAIVGTQGMGTGVMIEQDRLLTNCHVLAPNVLKGAIYAINPVTRKRFEITEAAFLVKDDACVAKAPGLDGQAIVMGDTRNLIRGTRFHNLGFANGTLTLSAGQYVGNIVRSQQTYMISTNFCAPGVSGGALVDDEGRLMGLTSGGTSDHRYCASLTAETARSVLMETMMPIYAFPTSYLTNVNRKW
jgi:hypothetical protein